MTPRAFEAWLVSAALASGLRVEEILEMGARGVVVNKRKRRPARGRRVV